MPRRIRAVLFALLCLPISAHAETLRFAQFQEATTLDPAGFLSTFNATVSHHIFDGLIRRGPDMSLQPGLALSWKTTSDTTWEFALRPGVTWHDGAPFTAEDAKASIDRIERLNVPYGFKRYTRGLADITVLDPLHLRIRTKGPDPILPAELSFLFVTKKEALDLPSEPFNQGRAMIGTGPYRFADYTRGTRTYVTRNDAYWGGKPAFDAVLLRPIPDEAARVAAMLAGDVDVIINVPPADVDQLKRRNTINVFVGPQDRVIMFLPSFAPTAKGITDAEGRPVEKNPFADIRVRRAISMAIDRRALIARVLDGLAQPAAQAFPDGYLGTSPTLKPVAFDPEGARRLLAEAGYDKGFGATLHCPNKLFLRDRETCEAVAGMLARVGIKLSIVLVPGSQFNTDRLKGEWPFYLQSAGTGMGEILPSFVAVAPTPDPARGLGPSNNQHYSNPEVDRLITAASLTMDDATRWGMQARAMEIWVRDDAGVIATHRQLSIFATRKGLRLTPREDGMYTPHELTVE